MTCTSEGKRTVAESADTGEPVHIYDAVSGLACRCICPGCGRPMVAHKGERRQHFQHAADSDGKTCVSSGETALHKFAKKTLAAALRLRLPALRETDGRNSLDVVHEGDFVFDSALLEKRHGEIVPDVVCRRAGRILHVEFRVTHPCGPEKRAALRMLNVGSIEIDLSGYRDQPLDTLAEAILSEAPRIWLHNPKVSVAQEKLAEIERKRLEQVEVQARALLAAAAEIAQLPEAVGAWEDGAIEHGLEPAIAGGGSTIGFLVRDEEWKSFALIEHGLAARKGFTRKDLFAAIKTNDWIDGRFGFVSNEVAEIARRQAGRNIRMPWEAVGDFLTAMQTSGMIMIDRRGKLAGGKLLYETIKNAKEVRERPQRRRDELSAVVANVISMVRSDFRDGFDFDAWFSLPLSDGVSAAHAIRWEEDNWREYLGRFERLRRTINHRPPHAADDLGLPVAREISARQESHRLAEERRASDATEKIEREASDREASLLRSAEAAMGGSAAAAWISVEDKRLGGLSPATMARRSQTDFWKAVDALERCKEEMRDQAKRDERRDKAMTSLRAAARTNFRREDLADLWMRQPLRGLDGARPIDHCIDDATLRACLQLLPTKARR